LVKPAHNLAAVIAQLPLSDLLSHTKSVAHVLHCSRRGVGHLKRRAWQGKRRVRRKWVRAGPAS
jgi:hypothetical protein